MADLISKETREWVVSAFLRDHNDIGDEISWLRKELKGKVDKLKAIEERNQQRMQE